MVRKSKTKNRKKLLVLAGVLILVAVGVGAFIFERSRDTKPVAHVTSTPSVARDQPSASTPSPASGSANAGGVIDKSGQTSGSLPPSAQWVSSSSGDITLQQPSASAIVQTGDTLSGLSNVSSVQFILTDNSVGLIDQGTLSVVNGKFSGTLEFTSHSSSGKLEVYSPNPNTGAEEDIINIDVNFNN